jgi:BirA family biotin operon repressor/biotin-[acetyl-CoA-carboxylase] ligase
MRGDRGRTLSGAIPSMHEAGIGTFARVDSLDSTMVWCRRELLNRTSHPGLTLSQAVQTLFVHTEGVNQLDVCEEQELDADLLPLSVLCADRQTAGTGRLGRPWTMESGKSFAGSFVFALDARSADLLGTGWLTTLTGICVIAALQEVASAYGTQLRSPLGLKWPNDIFCEGNKLGGILSQSIAQYDGTRVVVFGIGLNLFMDHDELPAAPATSLHRLTTSPLPDYACVRDDLAYAIARQLQVRLSEYLKTPTASHAALRQLALAESVTVGRPAHVTLVDSRAFDAQALDIDLDAALVVRTRAGGILTVTTGDVGVQ